MGKILVKRFDEPDEVISVPGNASNVTTLEIVLRSNFLPQSFCPEIQWVALRWIYESEQLEGTFKRG